MRGLRGGYATSNDVIERRPGWAPWEVGGGGGQRSGGPDAGGLAREAGTVQCLGGEPVEQPGVAVGGHGVTVGRPPLAEIWIA